MQILLDPGLAHHHFPWDMFLKSELQELNPIIC